MIHNFFQVRVSEEPAREFFVGEQNSSTTSKTADQQKQQQQSNKLTKSTKNKQSTKN